jgi:Ala-tRNA(Pro) deacylase
MCAVPLVGSLYGVPVYLEESLAAHEEIVFNTGTDDDTIRVSYDDFVCVAKPKISSLITQSG